ncbi:hypothetical protein DOY81_008026 [Sarcophaga bullata]|nr:hypothetical protein DOY81_008026 [Sarcophaga bullata]
MGYVISQPDVCWANNSIVLRRCDYKSGKWEPRVVNCTKFRRTNIHCPDDLIELNVKGEYICLKISQVEQPFDEHFCYGSNFVMTNNKGEIESEISTFLLNKYNIKSFWLPVKRYDEKKFNPFVIRLPGKNWNQMSFNKRGIFADDNGMLSDKHCVVVYIQRDVGRKNQVALQFKMTHCSEYMYSVCIFKKQFVAKSGCPQDFGALSHKPNECYGITWDGQKFPDDYRMLKVTEYFKKFNTLKIIFDEFDIVNDKYVEIEGTSEIPNGKWAIKTKSNQIKIVSSLEKIHGLCVEHIQSRKNVEMILRFDYNSESLMLTVYNKYYIWSNEQPENNIHCFTNAEYKELSKVEIKKIWENSSSTKTIFELKLESDYPGEYWCEAHTIFNFSYVSSKKLVAAKTKKGHVFVILMEYNPKDCLEEFSFSHNDMKLLSLCFKDALKGIRKSNKRFNDLDIHNVRIMDILNISPNSTYMKCICHITVSLKSSAVDSSIEQASGEENSIEDVEDILRHGHLEKARSCLVMLIKEFQPHYTESVRSPEFCFPENNWSLARIGQSATKTKFCLKQNGLPATRKCMGDFISGAYWEKVKPSSDKCIANLKKTLITKNLYNLDVKKISKENPEKAVKEVRNLLESNMKNLIPADFYYLAKIIRSTVNTVLKDVSRTKSFSPTTLHNLHWNHTQRSAMYVYNFSETTVDIVRIFNYLLEVNDSVIRPSIILNSTNILLDAFEYLIDYISFTDSLYIDVWPEQLNINGNIDLNAETMSSENQINEKDKEIDIIDYADVGVVVKIATNFIVFNINPLVANVTGIALFQTDVDNSYELYDESLLHGAFKNEYYRFVLANQSVDQLLNEKNILLGTFVPTLLWQRLDEVSMLANRTLQSDRPDPRIVIKIYSNDKLFQEMNNTSNKYVGGKIISISIPGHDKDLPDILPLILTFSEFNATIKNDSKNENSQQKQECSYWNYHTWANDGVNLLARSEHNNNTVLCGCTHMTPFAYLIGGSFNLSVDSEIEVIVKKIHKQALDIITLLGCSLSLFGIVGIFVTACTFRSWRQKANSKILLQLSAAIALQMILFCFVNTEENAHHLITNEIFSSCIAIGACLHYSILVQFCWMVIIAYLQFKRYVQVFGNARPKHFFIKSIIVGWVLPLLPVAGLVVFDSASYIPHHNELANPICYPSGLSLYITIVLPITMVIFANLIIFVAIIYNILKNPTGSVRHTEKRLALSQIRLLVLLFFLLGFTWIFGLLTTMKAGLVFSYLFCITATLQGFILFIYFIVMDPVTRRMWHGCLSKMCGIQQSWDNSSHTKETTQTS